MEIFLGILLLLAAVFLVVAVLMQHGKAKNLSGTIAGGAETFFGKNKAKAADKKLSRLTTIVAIVFVVIVIIVYVMQPNSTTGGSNGTTVTTDPGTTAVTDTVTDAATDAATDVTDAVA